MARHKADWSELYPELLISISGRLVTREDFRHFRAVCHKWRSAIPEIPQHLPFLSPLFPHRISYTPPPLSRYASDPLTIVANTTFLLQPHQIQSPNPIPFKPWLVTVEERHSGTLLLRRPLVRQSIVEYLPDNFPRVLDLSRFTVREVRTAYNFRSVGGYFTSKSKVVMFYDPSCASSSVDHCYALVLHGKGNLLALRLKDEGDCRSLRYSRVSCFDDIVNYEGAIWAIDRKGRVYVICYDFIHLRLRLFADDSVSTGYCGETRKRLVESSEGLYMIDRYHYEELIKFRVYKLNQEERKWNEVKSLDGRILFVSSDCCFFALAEDFPGCGGNCIFFPKDHFPAYYDSTYPDEFYFKQADKVLEVGVFHMDDGESGLISTYPRLSEIYWPPPWWLFSNTCPSSWDGEDNKEDALKVCSSEEMCAASLAVETETQATVNPSAMSDQEQFREIDVPWSEIPPKLLTEIGQHLKTPIDMSRFRAVCKKWRMSFPPPRSSNLLSSILPHKISTSVAPFVKITPSTSLHSLILVATRVYLLQPFDNSTGPSKSWLVAVEELNPGKLFLRLPLRRAAIEKLPDDFPRVLNSSEFRVSEIGREYNFRYASSKWDMFLSYNWWSFSNSHKVVLSPSGAFTSPAIDDTTALVLHDKGNLVSFRLRDENWLSIRYGSVTKFDDIINSNEKIYAIDRKGRAYVINCNSSTIFRVVSHALGSGMGPDRQKRLVELDGELYLLFRHSPDDKIFFRVYKLNEKQNKWEEVKSLGDRILFVTPTFCFFAFARDCPGWKGNCIVFPTDCLPTNSGSTYPDWRFFRRTIEELQIGVFYLDDKDGAKLVKSYSGYSDLFWPPPAWIQLAGCSFRVLGRIEQEQIDLPSKHTQDDDKSPALLDHPVEGQNLENSSTSVQQETVTDAETTPAITSPVLDSKIGASTAEFQGVDVSTELVPVLQKIWDKHGNIAEENAVRVRDPGTVARALESLAEAVVILKSTLGWCLDQSQADTLNATLSELQRMQFRVDWLVPFVEKALACQKKKSLVNDMEKLKKTKASVLEMKRQLAETERQVDDQLGYVVEVVNGLGPIHLDTFVGEGLLDL